MRQKLRLSIILLMMISLILTVSCSTIPRVGLQHIDKGHPAPDDGSFADKATTKEINKRLKLLKKYEDYYANEPTQWQRFWTTIGAFGGGIGLGLLIAP